MGDVVWCVTQVMILLPYSPNLYFSLERTVLSVSR